MYCVVTIDKATNMVTTKDKRYSTRMWSEKMCIQLINEYRERPILWDPKDPSYYKRDQKQLAWENISAALGIESWECRHKMGILLSSFRREKCKQLKAGCFTDSRWFAYPYLKFLMEKDEDRGHLIPSDQSEGPGSGDSMDGYEEPLYVMQSVVNDDRNVETLIITEDSIKREQCTTDTENDDFHSSHGTESNPRKRIRLDSEPNLTERDEASSSSGKRSKSNCKLSLLDEELDTFVKYVHSKMKKFSQTKVYRIQRDICEILFKADQELSETDSSK